MEEKVLIKSEIDKKTFNIISKGPLILLGIAAFISILLSINFERQTSYSHSTYITNGWKQLWRFAPASIPYFIIFLIICLALLSAIILGIVYLSIHKCELIITEKRVIGKAKLGKEVVLPLDMVSAFSTRKFLSTIAISTSSGITKFSLIGNYNKIGKVLSQKINQRQSNTEASTNKPSYQVDSTDEMFKYKSYLDAGIITQEEFDAKKKQLLGL